MYDPRTADYLKKTIDGWGQTMLNNFQKTAEKTRVTSEKTNAEEEEQRRRRGYQGTMASGALGVLGSGNSSLSSRSLLGL